MNPPRFSHIKKTWTNPGFRFGLLLGCPLLMLAGICFLRSVWLLFRTTEVFFWKVLYQRGFPLILAVCLLSLTLWIGLLVTSRSAIDACLRTHRRERFIFCALLLAGLACGLYICFSRNGLVKENLFFGKPTVPLLEWHILAGFLVFLASFLLEQLQPGGIPPRLVRLLPLLIWLSAFIIWISIPNQLGFFSPAGRAPNFEVYPFSDGSFYGHYARAAAAGMGFKGQDIPPRPLYIALLTFFHLLGNNHYDQVILFQTLLLALLPALVFLIGRDLHSVSAGLFAAVLVILRETHAIYSAPFGHNVSTTKYFFSDLPAALACAFFVLMMLRWIQARRIAQQPCLAQALMAGCALAIMTLIRTQSLCLILLLPLALFQRPVPDSADRNSDGRRFRHGVLGEAACFLTALAFCVAPWLLRNQQITGRLVFDHPMTQTAEMARSYNFDGADLSRLPGENDGAYSERLSAFISMAMRKHPAQILRFISAHFLNNEISNLRLFPVRESLADGSELLKSSEAFWEQLDNDHLSAYNLIFLGLAFALIVLGIVAACRNGMAVGFLPILCCLLFNLSTAVGRYSAGRYLIPVDWIVLLLFAIGGAACLQLLARVSGFTLSHANRCITKMSDNCCGGSKNRLSYPLGHKSVKADYRGGHARRLKKTPLAKALLFILLTALLIPAAEKLPPAVFEPASETEVREKLGSLAILPSDCAEENRLWIKALAIYPRYYAAGEGEPESAKQGYAAVDYGRLVFLTLSPGNFGTIEVRSEEVPSSLPDGATVWLSACQQGATSVAERLLIESPHGDVLYP